MAFGMRVATGDFLPIVKYDARAGKFFKMDKRPDGGSDALELPLGTAFALDLGSFEAGYVAFTAQGPVRHMVPYHGETTILPPQPQDKDQDGKPVYRAGFYAKIAGNALDGVREWCSNAAVLLTAMDELWNKCAAAPQSAQNQIPLIAIVGTVPVTTGGKQKSTNYSPVFEVRGWVPRPDVLGPRTVFMPHTMPVPGAGNGHAAPVAAPVQQPVQHVAPAPVAAPQAARPAGMPF